MNIDEYTRERGVTPVIGVILMVAITVILAAVIGTFVLGVGNGVNNNGPSVSFDFSYDSSAESVTTTFEAGNPVDAERLSLVVGGASADNGRHEFTGGMLGASNGEFGVGSSVTFRPTGGSPDLSSATIKIVWESQNTNPDAQRTSTVAVWTGPSA
jgi:flagellin-like protein